MSVKEQAAKIKEELLARAVSLNVCGLACVDAGVMREGVRACQ